jgi:deoxyribodipyrimidine photolyase-related protein
MSTLRVVLGDQLSRSLSALADLDPASDVVLLMEVAEETRYVPHHPQKIVLILAAMRHFAAELRAEGVRVDYVTLDDPANRGAFGSELARAVERHRPLRVVATEPGEWRVWDAMQGWAGLLGLPVDVRADTRFLCSREEFARWAGDRRQLRMEYFYREMRRRTGWLMDGAQPLGGRWNFDADNRKALPRGTVLPPARRWSPDAITREVMALVRIHCPDGFGDLDGFDWAVTRVDALAALAHFVEHALPDFGDYQDAMKTGEPYLFHAVLSPYLNIGLLEPREVCMAAIEAHARRHAPLHAVEGFVRQILGWREFVRGVYWSRMPDYADSNFLAANRPLPAFYWGAPTRMNCLRTTVEDTRRHAYAHHIQRLMVTGNFALLAGIAPAEIEAWYLAVYADAFDWVELPNTHGMVLHADGGVLASKPYAASGAYLNRMSDYCRGCSYAVQRKAGADACPFNVLYWHFLQRNEHQLRGNPRLAMPYRSLAAMSVERRSEIRVEGDAFLRRLDEGDPSV